MPAKDHKTAFYIFNMIVQFFYETFFAMALGYFLGKWLDKLLFNERVILTYILILLGIFAGLRNLIIRGLKYVEGEDNEK